MEIIAMRINEKISLTGDRSSVKAFTHFHPFTEDRMNG